jgi:predicted urease superfamily metal-dependent hydrolase
MIFVAFSSQASETGGKPSAAAVAKSIPIADTHMHFYGNNGLTTSEQVDQMNRNNVRWGGGVGAFNAEMQQLLGGRYFGSIGDREFTRVLFSDGEAGLQDADHPIFVEFFSYARQMLADRTVRGFGEIHVDNVSSSSGNRRFERRIPLNSPVIRKIYALADEFKGYVQIHVNRTDAAIEDLHTLSREFPNATTILSHCLPRSRAEDLAAIFAATKNVFCELSGSGVTHGIRRTFTDDGLRPEWTEMIEAYPDRVMIGSDPCCGLHRKYDEIIADLRSKILAHLSPSTMEKVAYGNAVRIFGLAP